MYEDMVDGWLIFSSRRHLLPWLRPNGIEWEGRNLYLTCKSKSPRRRHSTDTSLLNILRNLLPIGVYKFIYIYTLKPFVGWMICISKINTKNIFDILSSTLNLIHKSISKFSFKISMYFWSEFLEILGHPKVNKTIRSLSLMDTHS